jgi:hypothetical protein
MFTTFDLSLECLNTTVYACKNIYGCSPYIPPSYSTHMLQQTYLAYIHPQQCPMHSARSLSTPTTVHRHNGTADKWSLFISTSPDCKSCECINKYALHSTCSTIKFAYPQHVFSKLHFAGGMPPASCPAAPPHCWLFAPHCLGVAHCGNLLPFLPPS